LLASQVANPPTQVHFCVSCLEAAFHRGLHPFFGIQEWPHLDEEIGIATNVLCCWERNCIHPLLDCMTCGREVGDPMRERSDEIAEFARG
jgi:hypothetical protein